MTGQEEPILSLGEPPKRLTPKANGVPRGWLWSLLCLQLLIVGGLIAFWLRADGISRVPSVSGSSADELKAAAIALEERSLYAEAARIWHAYLGANPTDPQRAEILYRAGKLAIQADDFNQAVTALVQAEQAAVDDSDLKTKIGPLIIDCLRRLGRYGEVGRELSRRVEFGAEQTGKGPVLATIAGDEFTEADLDRMIERRVDQMLSVQSGHQDVAHRDALLKQFSSPAVRRQIFEEVLQTELFSRRACEMQLDRDEEFLRARRFLEENLLANRFLAREFGKVHPTDVDIESYYKAYQKQYEEPETMTVVLLELDEQQDVQVVRKRITSSNEFRLLASGRIGEADSKQTQAPHHIVLGRSDPKLGDTDTLFKLSPGEWTREPHVHGGMRFLVLCDSKAPARTPPLSTIRWRVEADYQSRKRRELSDKLYRDLMVRYNVRIRQVETVQGGQEGQAKND